MGDYFLEPQAQRDVRDIREFISDHSVAAAGRLMERLEIGFRNLADHPFIGRERPELGVDLRSRAVENYVIIYRPVASGVEIVRVINGARDISRLFQP